LFPPLARKSGLLSDRLNDGFDFADRDERKHVIIGQAPAISRSCQQVTKPALAGLSHC
jgi:hypothetical protein